MLYERATKKRALRNLRCDGRNKKAKRSISGKSLRNLPESTVKWKR
jgi:hypothetical protein